MNDETCIGCELLNNENKSLYETSKRLRAALMKIEDLTDKGTAIIFPEATLKEIQKIAGDALDDDEVLLHDDNGLRLDGN